MVPATILCMFIRLMSTYAHDVSNSHNSFLWLRCYHNRKLNWYPARTILKCVYKFPRVRSLGHKLQQALVFIQSARTLSLLLLLLRLLLLGRHAKTPRRSHHAIHAVHAQPRGTHRRLAGHAA